MICAGIGFQSCLALVLGALHCTDNVQVPFDDAQTKSEDCQMDIRRKRCSNNRFE